MPPPDAPCQPAYHPSWWRIFFITQGLCLGIGVLLVFLAGWGFAHVNLVFSFCIGNATSAFINGGRWLVWHHLVRTPQGRQAALDRGWIGWRWTVPLLLLGTLLGYELGAALGGALTGYRHHSLFSAPVQEWGLSGLFTLLASVGLTWFFHSRARIAQAEQQAADVARLAAETQLTLLQSQLEPHMMFNTLANLRALIGVDPVRAQQMLDHLIDFLRATLQASRTGAHPLSAEFQRVADYLALMQIRMGPRLQTQLDLPEELASLPVPPLLLQPLVENAIKHGLEPQRRGGLIHVQALREGDALLLRVEDSGRGLAAAQAGQAGPAAAGSPVPGTGFGTRQVQERLSTLYGERARFTLSDRPSTTSPAAPGTRAEIRLPCPPRPTTGPA
ncbi:sensor histidine kinase [Ideonella livida]|uniref:Sensor histidine kinase n=1 Tax=Ideonella livida TaxID=2707176 RepID=A0A7C9PF88_9BURK|nr:histidine kinase [Ideonella livida]NDY90228.1 sensor histidine kinase [Ideonella livida]